MMTITTRLNSSELPKRRIASPLAMTTAKSEATVRWVWTTPMRSNRGMNFSHVLGSNRPTYWAHVSTCFRLAHSKVIRRGSDVFTGCNDVASWVLATSQDIATAKPGWNPKSFIRMTRCGVMLSSGCRRVAHGIPKSIRLLHSI